MDKKERKFMKKLFSDADNELFEILISKCIVTIRPEQKKEKDNEKDQELIAM